MEIANSIPNTRVKPGAHKHKFRFKLPHNRQQDTLHNKQIIIVREPIPNPFLTPNLFNVPGEIDLLEFPSTSPSAPKPPVLAMRVKLPTIIFMLAYEHNIFIRLKKILGPVSVVHVPVKYQNFLDSMFPSEVICCQCNVIQKTEPLRFVV